MSEKIVRSMCPRNCYDARHMLTHVREGKIVKIEDGPDHTIAKGLLCPKAELYINYVYTKDRILYPHKRVREKV